MFCKAICTAESIVLPGFAAANRFHRKMVVIPFETDAVSEICLAFPPNKEKAAKLNHLFSVIREEQIQPLENEINNIAVG